MVLTNHVTNHVNWLLLQCRVFISHPIAAYVSPWVPKVRPHGRGWGKGQRVADIQPSSVTRNQNTFAPGCVCLEEEHILPVSAKELAAPCPLPPFLGRCWLFCWLEQEGILYRSQVLKCHLAFAGRSQAEETLLGLQEPCKRWSVDHNQNGWFQNCRTESGVSNSIRVCLESNFYNRVLLFIEGICDCVCI